MNMLQILDQNGRVDPVLEPTIPDGTLIHMFNNMVLVRLLDEKGMRLQRQGRISFNIPSTGQEATQIGAVAALNTNDWIFPAYREPGMAFFRGFPLQDLINHWFNTENDPQKGRRLPGLFGSVKYRYVNPSAPIGTQIIQAAGAAYAIRYLKKNEINIVFFGDGATSSNDFHSGLNFGAVYNVPTIFFCQNNQWAISVPLSQQTASKSIVSKAEGYGMYGIQIDGNDVLAVYKTVTDAATKARSGEGPTFIEAVTYRIGPHTSSDDPTRYRPKNELEEWKKRDPISRFEKYLIKKEIVNEDHRKNTLEKFNQEIDALIASAEKLPPPKLETMFSDVYQSTPWHLEKQKTDLLSIGARNDK